MTTAPLVDALRRTRCVGRNDPLPRDGGAADRTEYSGQRRAAPLVDRRTGGFLGSAVGLHRRRRRQGRAPPHRRRPDAGRPVLPGRHLELCREPARHGRRGRRHRLPRARTRWNTAGRGANSAPRSRASSRRFRRWASARATGWRALLPNMPEAVAAMLAAASLGAVWSSASPDFGPRGVLDRFGQIEPKVLFTRRRLLVRRQADRARRKACGDRAAAPLGRAHRGGGLSGGRLERRRRIAECA